MDRNKGFVSLWRSITDWGWYSDVNTTRLFIHLLITVNYIDKNWMGIQIKRGQRICTLRGLSEETGLTVQELRTCINRLKSTQEITQETTRHGSLVTVVKYCEYQDSQEKPTQDTTQKTTRDRHKNDTKATQDSTQPESSETVEKYSVFQDIQNMSTQETTQERHSTDTRATQHQHKSNTYLIMK